MHCFLLSLIHSAANCVLSPLTAAVVRGVTMEPQAATGPAHSANAERRPCVDFGVVYVLSCGFPSVFYCNNSTFTKLRQAATGIATVHTVRYSSQHAFQGRPDHEPQALPSHQSMRRLLLRVLGLLRPGLVSWFHHPCRQFKQEQCVGYLGYLFHKSALMMTTTPIFPSLSTSRARFST